MIVCFKNTFREKSMENIMDSIYNKQLNSISLHFEILSVGLNDFITFFSFQIDNRHSMSNTTNTRFAGQLNHFQLINSLNINMISQEANL